MIGMRSNKLYISPSVGAIKLNYNYFGNEKHQLSNDVYNQNQSHNYYPRSKNFCC